MTCLAGIKGKFKRAKGLSVGRAAGEDPEVLARCNRKILKAREDRHAPVKQYTINITSIKFVEKCSPHRFAAGKSDSIDFFQRPVDRRATGASS